MAISFRAGAPLEGIGVRPYQPQRMPFTGTLDHRGGRRREEGGGWLLKKDGYRLPAGLRLGKPTSGAEAAQYGLGPGTGCLRRSCTEEKGGR